MACVTVVTKETTPDNVLLLDTSAFIQGYMATEVNADYFTAPAILDELKEGSLHRLRFLSAVRNGHLKVISPAQRFLVKIDEVSRLMGEKDVLSSMDKQLLALGLSLKSEGKKIMIVSDDYSVQNVANMLGLGFKSLATPGIKKRYKWVVYCPGCRKRFDQSQKDNLCPVCGTQLKRKPVAKKIIN